MRLTRGKIQVSSRNLGESLGSLNPVSDANLKPGFFVSWVVIELPLL